MMQSFLTARPIESVDFYTSSHQIYFYQAYNTTRTLDIVLRTLVNKSQMFWEDYFLRPRWTLQQRKV